MLDKVFTMCNTSMCVFLVSLFLGWNVVAVAALIVFIATFVAEIYLSL